MAFEKLKKFIDGEDEVTSSKPADEYYKDTFKETSKNSKMVLIEPRAYSEAQSIADYLKSRNAVIVNLKRVTPDQAKRIVDFLSGALYAIGGEMQKLGNGIFLCTPNNVGVEGKMGTDDKAVKKNKEEEFDW